MNRYTTVSGSLKSFEKGRLTIIDDNPKYYCHSNVFEVASRSKPYEKVAVAKNLEYVVEAIRAEGQSAWYAAQHDEFVVVLDGEVTVTLAQLGNLKLRAMDGTQAIDGAPNGKKMGVIHLKRYAAPCGKSA